MSYLGFVKLTQNAFKPEKPIDGSAGFDLKSPRDCLVPKRDRELILTDLAFNIPRNCCIRIAPRSGLGVNHAIDVGAGVVDSNFTGNVGVLLLNHSGVDFIIKRGDRIAQLISEVIITPELVEESLDDLIKTKQQSRGARGFGSSGLQ